VVPLRRRPRTCIGAHFALLESLTVLAAVLDGYRLETPDRPIPVVPKITLHPAGPVEARLTAL
jgi:cytochrome P450